MATRLYFQNGVASSYTSYGRVNNDAKLNGNASWWSQMLLSNSRGSAYVSAAANTVSGATNGVEVTDGTYPLEWLSPPLGQDVTIDGLITFNLWAVESSMSANTGIQCVIERLAPDGSLTTIINSEKGSELPYSAAAAQNWTADPASIALNKGDRLRIRVALNDANTMVTGYTGTFYFNGDTQAAVGDSYIEFNETFSFITSQPAGTSLYLTDSAAEVDPNGASYDAKLLSRSRGAGATSKAVNTVAGPTNALLWTAGAGGNYLEWFSNQVAAFTLTGAVWVKLRALESNSLAKVRPVLEIAVCDASGANPVVWSKTPHAYVLSTSEGSNEFVVSGDDYSVPVGSRIRVRVYIDDYNGGMATSYTATLYYAGAAGASGDSFITFTQTLSFPKYIAVGQATESDTAQNITPIVQKVVTVGQVLETDTARITTPSRTFIFTNGKLGSSNGRQGPYKIGSYFYAVLEGQDGNYVSVFRASDPTGTWSKMASHYTGASGVGRHLSSVVVGSYIDLVYGGIQIQFVRYDTTTESFGTAEDASDLGPEWDPSIGTDVAYLSGYHVVVYCASDNGDPMTSWLLYSTRDSNGDWSYDFSLKLVEGQLLTRPSVVVGSSSRIHVFFNQNGDQLHHITAGQGSSQQLDQGNSSKGMHCHPVSYVDGSDTKLAVLYINNVPDALSIMTAVSADVPTWTQTDDVSSTTVENAVYSTEGRFALVVAGTTLHALFVDDATTDLWHDIAPWTGSEEELQNNVTTGLVHATVYDRNGTKIAYLWDNNGVLSYGEISILSALVEDVLQATETDTAQAITIPKTRLIGMATETDTATSITHAKALAVGLATETDTATAITRLKNKSIGQAIEADIAWPATPNRQRSIGQAIEADIAQPLLIKKQKAIGQASEADTAQGTAWAPKHRMLGLTSEADTAFPITENPNRVYVGQATETDTAFSVGVEERRLVGLTVEADTAQPMAWAPKHRLVSMSSETDTAQPVTYDLRRLVGQASEQDTAAAIIIPKIVAVGLATETDTAFQIFLGGNPIGLAEEVDTAQPVTPLRTYAIGMVTETDTGKATPPLRTIPVNQILETDEAQPITAIRRYFIALGQATETNTAFSVGHARAFPLGQSSEADTAQVVTPKRKSDLSPSIVPVAQALETDTAHTLVLPKFKLVGQATETDTAFGITESPNRIYTAQAQETDTAFGVTVLKTKLVAVGQASETDTAWAATPLRTKAIGQALEADTGQEARPTRKIAVGLAIETDTAFTATPLRSRLVGQAVETDSAFAVGHYRVLHLAQAIESDTALAIYAPKRRLVGLASEVDSSQTVTFVPRRLVGMASEADTAFPLEAPGTRLIGQTLETDEAFQISRLKTAAIGQAAEADTATALLRKKIVLLGQAVESDTAHALLHATAHAIGQALESDTSFGVTLRRTVVIGQALETDTAHRLVRRVVLGFAAEVDTSYAVAWSPKHRLVGDATETDSAFSIGHANEFPIGQAAESDSAQFITRKKVRSIGMASETDSAGGLTRNKTRTLSMAQELDVALMVGSMRKVSIGQALESDTAFIVGRLKVRAIGLAAEVDSASQLIRPGATMVWTSAETDQAMPIAVLLYNRWAIELSGRYTTSSEHIGVYEPDEDWIGVHDESVSLE
jgi:hypothetical protein